MKKKIFLLSSFIVILFSAGLKAQLLDDAKKLLNQGTTGLSEKDAADGIREALVKGTNESVKIVSKTDGYFGNPQIKIPWPKDAKDIESKLRDIGLGNKVDEVVTTINHAAENAAKDAETIFVTAVKQMTVTDAINIVKGKNDAATQYLSKTTTPELTTKFTPVIKAALDKEIGRAHV